MVSLYGECGEFGTPANVEHPSLAKIQEGKTTLSEWSG
jgi:hypothetical protein